jgi:hypothetical protein
VKLPDNICLPLQQNEENWLLLAHKRIVLMICLVVLVIWLVVLVIWLVVLVIWLVVVVLRNAWSILLTPEETKI